MITYNEITLQYRNSKRNNYMSLSDLVQDLKIESLIKILPSVKELKNQMIVMGEIDLRDELSDDDFFELMETCNGI